MKFNGTTCAALIIGFLSFAFVAIARSPQRPMSPASANTAATLPAPSEGRGLDDIDIRVSRLNKTGFGNILEITVSIINRNRYAIRDVTIYCQHYANSGTPIDSNRQTIYERVPAGQARIVTDFNMGFIHTQAQQSSCKITDFARA